MNTALALKRQEIHASTQPNYLKEVAVVAAEQQLSAIARCDGKNSTPLEKFGKLYKQHGGPFLDVYTGYIPRTRKHIEEIGIANAICDNVTPQLLGHLIYVHGHGRSAAVTGDFLEYDQEALQKELVTWKRRVIIHGTASEELITATQLSAFEELSATTGSLADIFLKRGLDRGTAFRLWRTHGSLLSRTTTIDELREELAQEQRPRDPMLIIRKLEI